MDDDWGDNDWDDGDASWTDEADDEPITCPECGADVHPDADACPECGYWITEADRSAAWRSGSATGRIIRVGLLLLAAAAAAGFLNMLFG